ncbi:hypothetical protein I3760_01G187800 [Carya illinoinensis]|nr:hypothetical protein I3760_01G187800 [Carya illinoinensis]
MKEIWHQPQENHSLRIIHNQKHRNYSLTKITVASSQKSSRGHCGSDHPKEVETPLGSSESAGHHPPPQLNHPDLSHSLLVKRMISTNK